MANHFIMRLPTLVRDSRRLRPPRRKSRRPGLAVTLLLALVTWGGCSQPQSNEAAPTVTVQVVTATTKAIEHRISADAVIYPVRQAALVPKITAPVREFFVQRGSHVHAGQLLVQLENRDLAAAVTDSRGAYEQAEAGYVTATKQSMPEEIRKAELDTKAAREAMDLARNVYTGQQNLFRQGATAHKNLEDANLAFVQARNQYDLSVQHLQSLQKLGTVQELKAAEGQLTSARGKYEAAKAQMDFAEIRSPIDGVVTDRPLYAGEMPPAGAPVITVMDLSQVIVRAHIDQRQAAALKVGDTAYVAPAGSTDDFPGKVTLISPALDPGSTTVEVWVQAANPRERLRPGSSVRVTIIAETVPDAVVIPAVALLAAADGSASVMVVEAGNTPRQRSVKVGIRDGDEAQISDGLRAGERVVTVGAYDLFKEDPDVLAKTHVQVAEPSSPEPGKAGD